MPTVSGHIQAAQSPYEIDIVHPHFTAEKTEGQFDHVQGCKDLPEKCHEGDHRYFRVCESTGC